MRPLITLLLFAVLTLRAAENSPAPLFTAHERSQGYRDNVILAKPLPHHRASVDASEVRERVRVRQKFARFGDLRVISLDGSEAADRAIARLRATGRYEFVERDRLMRPATIPDDPGFSQQWSLNNTGQSAGVAGADIRAVAAWDILHDAPNVIVAVLDSGVNYRHEDIAANIWRNPAPTFGDVNGASFVNGVRTNDPADVQGHGTHCAGILGATGNNANGLAGVAWRVQIMPVRIMSAEGLIATSDFAAGVDYAIGHGAQIINVSLFTDTHSQADLAVIRAARDAGVILVAAAGNEAANVDTSPRYYPGAYPLDNIVAVGASTRTETLASYSNYGAWVDVVAPGSNILSLFFGNNTGGLTLSGTSMAAPHVVGVLALIKARFPNDTYRQLINRLHRSVDVLPAYAGKAVTGGRINLLKALTTTENRPFNDDFAGRARVVGPNLSLRTNNGGAGAEPGEPAHAGRAASATLWWEWTAPATGNVSIDTIGSGYDTVLAVYTGASLDSLVVVAANDDDRANPTSRLSFTAQAGTAYQISVGGKNGASGATLVSLGSAPANDAFASAVTLTGESTQITARNELASREPGEPRILGFAGGASVWYRWTAPRSGRFQISVATLNYFDPLLAVYTGTALNALTPVATSDNIGPGAENVDALCVVNAVGGTTYVISVDAKTLPNTGEFTLSISDALWQAPTLRGISGAPAVAPDGTLYVGSTDFNAYAFHPDGSPKWRHPTQDALDHSSPAVGADGTVYVHSLDGNLHALRADGTVRWRRDFGAVPGLSGPVVCSSPAIAVDGTVYLKAGDGYLHALEPGSGATRWRFNVNAPGSYASPAIGSDGTIYQGSTDRRFYAIAPDGTLRWTFNANDPIQTAPAIDAAGNLYFCGATTGRLFCLTPAGTARWTYSGATGGSTSSPSLSADGTTVYFGARDRRLHAVVVATGTARWQFTAGGEIGDSSPAVDANGVIYFGAHDQKIYAINANGTLKRTFDAGGPIDSSPAIAGTALYIGSDDAKLYAFDIGAGPAGGPWPQFRANARHEGRVFADIPAIGNAPLAQSLIADSTLTLSVVANGASPLAIQWTKDGVALPGATTATLTVPGATAANAGDYVVTVSNALGSVASAPAVVAVAAPDAVANGGRLVNLSILTSLASASDVLAIGAVVGGEGTVGSKPLLVRAVGPSLGAFRVAAAVADPKLAFFTGANAVAENDNWGGDAVTAAVSTRVGAFSLTTGGSRDAALYLPALAAGTHSIRITGVAGATGAVLAELYDASPGPVFASTTPRLINISVLKNVGPGLLAGFVIAGGGSRAVLIRAVGPGLAAFGVTDAATDPRLELFDGAGRSIASNDNWGGTSALVATFAQVGAFALAANSRDAALVATLPPGNYTAQVSGVAGATGSVLLEVYEAP